jgi:hypothetical protein
MEDFTDPFEEDLFANTKHTILFLYEMLESSNQALN